MENYADHMGWSQMDISRMYVHVDREDSEPPLMITLEPGTETEDTGTIATFEVYHGILAVPCGSLK